MIKKVSIALALLVLLGCLTACSFSKNVSGALAGEAEATPKVEEMMSLLAEEDISKAKSLMHPQVPEASAESATQQMSDYLTGRKVRTMEQMNINVSSSAGTAGKMRQEQVAYKVTLDDGDIVYLNVVYLSNTQGVGFASFQLVLGVV